MSDIGLTWDTVNQSGADFSLTANDLATDDGLETAVLLSLFTDRRADPGDVLPDSEKDRRGWWGDVFPNVPGDRIGSRLWLLDRAKTTPDTPILVVAHVKEALQWLIEDKVCDRIDVESEIVRSGFVGYKVTIYRPTRDPATFRYNFTWDSQAVRDL